MLGENASGKTTLLREFLGSGRYRRWIVIDQKHDFQPPAGAGDFSIVRKADESAFSGRYGRKERILFRPPAEAGGGAINWALHQCWIRAQKHGKREPTIVLVDEGLDAAQQYAGRWLQTLVVAGRSLNVGVWVNSQRPVWIPKSILTEAWRIYVFHLGFEEDDKLLSKFTKGRLSPEQLAEATANYAFVEVKRDPTRAGSRIVTRFPPLRIT